MKSQQVAEPNEIGPYETVLRDALAADACRPRRERRPSFYVSDPELGQRLSRRLRV